MIALQPALRLSNLPNLRHLILQTQCSSVPLENIVHLLTACLPSSSSHPLEVLELSDIVLHNHHPGDRYPRRVSMAAKKLDVALSDLNRFPAFKKAVFLLRRVGPDPDMSAWTSASIQVIPKEEGGAGEEQKKLLEASLRNHIKNLPRRIQDFERRTKVAEELRLELTKGFQRLRGADMLCVEIAPAEKQTGFASYASNTASNYAMSNLSHYQGRVSL